MKGQSHWLRAAPRASRRAGFTLMEVSLAIAILVVALLAMSASTLRTHSLRRQSRERAVAQNAVRTIEESIQAISNRLLHEDPEEWGAKLVEALQPGGELGDTFPVPELTRLAGAPAVGSIQVVTDETQTDAGLGMEVGMPRDLNGDGDAIDDDVVDTARLLPVILTTRWTGVSGESVVRHPFYVIRY